MVTGVGEAMVGADLAIILIVAALMGFLATRSGQPTIIAYILTGILLGPVVFGVITPGILTHTMAELGLAFLLFLLGIKMRLEDIRHLLGPIVKISLPQMTVIALVGGGLAIGLGFAPLEAILIGLAVMYSSTAVVIKMLTDKGTATSLHGKIDVGVLLVQDIVVVILLALLAAGRPERTADLAITLGTILILVVVIAAIAVLASRYLLPPVFRRVAADSQVFFIIAVSWLFLFVFASAQLDLSIEMGAFLAGLAIAQLPFSKELQARINPITDLFILIFFVSVSLELTAGDLFEYWREAVIAAAVLMPAKFIVFFGLLSWQEFDLETTFLGSVNMTQVSEFGLVVGAVAVAGGFIGEGILGFLTLLALFTMGVSVYVIQFNDVLYTRVKSRLGRWGDPTVGAPPEAAYRDHMVIVGFDEIARRAVALLEDRYDQILVVDRQVDEIDEIEAAGYDAIFGDIGYQLIRDEANVADAAFVFSSSVQVDINQVLLHEAPEDAIVFVEAETLEQAEMLYRMGADFVILGPTLAADQLRRYIESFFADPETFKSVLAADLEILRSGGRIPEPEPRRGRFDD